MRWGLPNSAGHYLDLASVVLGVALTPPSFERLEEADRLDTALRTTGQLVGPLHGIPMAVKDCIEVTGLPMTVGFVEKRFVQWVIDACTRPQCSPTFLQSSVRWISYSEKSTAEEPSWQRLSPRKTARPAAGAFRH
jgi:hypothetical protein